MAKPRTDGYIALVNSFFNEQKNSTGRHENLRDRMKDFRRNNFFLSQGQIRFAQSHDAMARMLDSDVVPPHNCWLLRRAGPTDCI